MTTAARQIEADAEPRACTAAAPLLIMLPDGFALGGVTTWAVRLARAISGATTDRRGALRRRSITIATHAGARGNVAATLAGLPGVEIVELPATPSLRDASGDLRAFIPAYLKIIERLSRESGQPCVIAPNSLGDAFGITAAISMTHPELIRVVGWQHSDIAYDTQVLAHYEPIVSAFAGVSTRIVERLRERMPGREGDIAWVPYGIETAGGERRADANAGTELGTRERPLRLIYTGRMEHEQKRIGALIRLPSELAALGIAHEMTFVGDGPAAVEVDQACTALSDRDKGVSLVRRAAVAPDDVGELLNHADMFVLTSRYEGLSVSMLEAMMHGCVPVVTRVESGAADAIRHGESGMLVEFGAGDTEHDVARAMARAIGACVRQPGGIQRLSNAARLAARERFGIERHAMLVSELIDRAVAAPPRVWPTNRACAFTGSGATGGNAGEGGSGSVPADGATRLRRVLESIARRGDPSGTRCDANGDSSSGEPGRRNEPVVMLHGAGRHTIELASVLAASPVRIVGIVDDDPAKWGTALLGWSVCSPEDAISRGVTDLVISSWMHADTVYARRGAFESSGVRVHHLYRD